MLSLLCILRKYTITHAINVLRGSRVRNSSLISRFVEETLKDNGNPETVFLELVGN